MSRTSDLFQLLGRGTSVGVAVKVQSDSQCRQAANPVVHVHHAAIVGRVGDIERDDMERFLHWKIVLVVGCMTD